MTDSVLPRRSYCILGSGKQGVAAAYDALLFGDAAKVTIADSQPSLARAAVRRLKSLAGKIIEKKRIALAASPVDGRRAADIKRVVAGHDAVLSALPYYLNEGAARAAIAAKAHYCDLGGYFEMTRRILALGPQAKKAGVALVPDCGVSPGMCNSLAACAIDRLDRAQDVFMYCGGLPQKPQYPLGYKIVFNLEGLLGNYFGEAYVLRDGKVKLEPSFSGRETLRFTAPLGNLEAVTTGGATSTCPWTYRGRLRNYVYKTLRYPGHFDKIQLLKDLGLMETAPVPVNGAKVSPRALFVAVAGPRLRFPDDRDLLVMRVIVRGRRRGAPVEVVYDVLDYYDPRTGFTAMQRTTGFSAAIVMESLARGLVSERGAVPLERALAGRYFLEQIRRRGIDVKETTRKP